MQLGMVGLGRMGANMVRRLLAGGHECVVYDRSPKVVSELEHAKAVGSSSLADFAKKLGIKSELIATASFSFTKTNATILSKQTVQ